MFLFDKQRTGRLSTSILPLRKPSKVWTIKLPSIERTAPESTAIEDEYGNLYFGAHNGTIYCAHPCRGVQWSWNSTKKIYSSPLWINEFNFAINTGSGLVVALSRTGELVWSCDMCARYHRIASKNRRALIQLAHAPFVFDRKMKSFHYLASWSSPNIFNHTVYSVGFHGGLYAVDSISGAVKWTLPLGFPQYYKAGVAISDNGSVFVAANRHAYCLNEKGILVWKAKGGSLLYDVWSNPSLDERNKQVYMIWSRGESASIINAFDTTTGKVKWSTRIRAGVRGSATIGRGDYLYVPALDGKIIALDKLNGCIVHSKQIAIKTRGLWTSASILKDDFLLVTPKVSEMEGKLVCLDYKLEYVWSIPLGKKALSVPTINKRDEIVVGTWDSSIHGFK